MYMWALLHLLFFNESLLHNLSIMCVMIVICVCMNDSVHIPYYEHLPNILLSLVDTSACGEATCDEL